MLTLLSALLLADVVVPEAEAQSPQILFTSDRIFTVLTVVVIIFVGVLVMLLRQERRLAKIEKEIQKP